MEEKSPTSAENRPPDKIVIIPPHSILYWLLELFDPPPLSSMTFAQKVARVCLLCGTLVVGSIIVAMIGALGLYLVERGRELGSMPEMLNGIGIIVVGVSVNSLCLAILFQIKKADHKVLPRRNEKA